MIQQYLRRYTNLPSLISILRERKITLLNPRSWDDKNDAYFLEVYKEKKKFKSVLALCFTQANETYHHWKIFADSSSGVCIFFIRKKLLSALKEYKDIRSGSVKYYSLREIRSRKPKVYDLPFIKRRAFEDDQEFRIIYQSAAVKLSKFDIALPVTCISKIVLSPWIHKNLTDSVNHVLHSIPDCGTIEIERSTIVNNKEWKIIGDSTREL
jgi:hypothetical protein